MGTEHNQPDSTVDKILAALRDADPPEGMQTRIAQRLDQHATATPRRLYLPASFTLAGAWWRGAFTGAAAATLAAALLLFAGHLLRPHTSPQQPVADTTSAAPTYVATSTSKPTGDTQATPCVHQALLRTHPAALPPKEQILVAETRIDTTAPSRPAPALPLTAEERALIQLAHTADPKVLATPDPETQAKLDAQEAAEFQKFFAPPPAPPAKENNE